MELFTSSWTSVWRHHKALVARDVEVGGDPDPLAVDGFVPVRTSVGVPRFWAGSGALPYVRAIAPFGVRVRGLKGDQFASAYERMLDRHGLYDIREELELLAKQHDSKPLVLLCFEPNRADCHRGLFARWFEAKTGIAVPELKWSTDWLTWSVPSLA